MNNWFVYTPPNPCSLIFQKTLWLTLTDTPALATALTWMTPTTAASKSLPPPPVSDDGYTIHDEILNQVENLKEEVSTLKEHVAVLTTAYMQLSTGVNRLPTTFRDLLGTYLSLVPPFSLRPTSPHPPSTLQPGYFRRSGATPPLRRNRRTPPASRRPHFSLPGEGLSPPFTPSTSSIFSADSQPRLA